MRTSISMKSVLTLLLAVCLIGSALTITSHAIDFDSEREGPYLEKVKYSVIASQDQRVLALQAGTVDVVVGFLSPIHLPALEADPDIEIASTLRSGYGHLTINCRDYPLNISGFRRAFAFAYDKERVTSEILDGFSQEHDSLVPYTSSWCIEEDFASHYYTNQSAIGNAILDDLNFTVQPDGWRTAPDGSPIDIEIIYGANSPDIGGGCAQIGVDALESLHIHAHTLPQDFNTYISTLDNHGAYDMIFYATNFYSDNVDWLAYKYWSERAAEPLENPSNFQNATYDSYRDDLINGTTYQVVFEASSNMQKILHHNVPLLVVYENMYFSGYRTDRFEGQVNDVYNSIACSWTNLKTHLPIMDGGPLSGTLRIAMGQEPDSFNFMTSNSAYSKMILDNMYDSLMKRNADGEFIPWLAEDYLIQNHDDNPSIPLGHTRMTFNIIQPASWTDGTPLTASDIAFSFNYYIDSGVYGNPKSVQLMNLAAAYAPVPTQLVVEFDTEGYWNLGRIAELEIIPAHIFSTIGASGWNTWNPVFNPTHPHVTSGPFNITDVEFGEFYELTYNPLFAYSVWGTGSNTPEITPHDDVVVVESPHMGQLTWQVQDDNPLVYRIYHNDSLIEASLYESSSVSISLDGLSLGVHNFSLLVQDYEYQEDLDDLQVSVIPDTFVPDINGSLIVELTEGSTNGFVLDWSVFDHNPSNYTVDVNGTALLTNNWDWGTDIISYNLRDLEIANYTYTLTVRDVNALSSSWSILVSVVERPPFITLASLLMIAAGVAGVTIVGIIVLKVRK